MNCYHKEPGNDSEIVDCETHSSFKGSKYCQKTFDADSIGKSCVNDEILKDIQELFPKVNTTDGCYNVTLTGRNGTVCMCSSDECNAAFRATVTTILQIIVIASFLVSTYWQY